jgi:uncharacterized protein
MQCPTCPNTSLVMTDRQGVEIDYCPQCRGVWLDRGELDKLMDRAASEAAAASAAQARPGTAAAQHSPAYHRDFDDSDYPVRSGGYGKRRKSWLNEIFD